jgi:hypothetical protein
LALNSRLSLSKKPVEIDRTGLIRAIDNIEEVEESRNRPFGKRSKSEARNGGGTLRPLKTVAGEGRTRKFSIFQDEDAAKMKIKVNVLRDVKGYEEHLKKEAYNKLLSM